MDKIHLRIGSNPDNDMVIVSDGVDGSHLELFCDNEGNVFITDLNTKNGTFINGEELNGYALLSQGDKVVLGRHYVFRWESFVRKESIVEPISNNINRRRENYNDTIVESSDKKKNTNLSVSNLQLILIYGAIAFILSLMFFVF